MTLTNNRPPKALQFINVSNPEAMQRASKHRAAIRSHAARTTHAAARQARTVEYQAGRLVTPAQRPVENDIHGVGVYRLVEAAPRTTTDVEFKWQKEVDEATIVVPSPFVYVLGSKLKDPFESFVTSCTPTEQFLLHHCKYDGLFIVCSAVYQDSHRLF